MNKVVLILLIATGGFGLVSLHLVGELRAERSQVAALQTQIEQLRSSSSLARPAPNPIAQSQAELASRIGNPTAPPPARSASAAASTASPVFTVVAAGSREEQIQSAREMLERQQALMRDPAYRSAMIEQQKNSMRTFQRGLQRELGLSDEQYERVLELQAEQQLRGQDVTEPYLFTEGPADPAAAQAAAQEQARKYQELQQRNENELSALLGEQKYRAYQEYQRTLGARSEVNQLNVALAEAGVPLREDQMKPMIRAIQESNDQLSRDMSQMSQNVFFGQSAVGVITTADAAPPDWQKRQFDVMREHQKRIREAASRVLDDEQLEILASQQEEGVRMRESQIRMMQAQQDAIARGEVPPTPVGGFGVAIANGVAVPD
jgi:hypothetical protein